MSNEMQRLVIDPDTGETLDLFLSEEELVASFSNPQIIRDKLAAKTAVKAKRDIDFGEMRGQKAQDAIDRLDADIKKFDTATAGERLAMQKRMATYLLVIMRILKHQLDD
jgi:hypothetical protein